MGHSRCGAIQATIDELKSPKSQSNNFYSIVDHIRPSLTPLLQIDQNQDLLLQQAVRANIRSSVHQLKHSSKILEKLVKKKKLLIIGAEYSLDTGIVTFFDK